MKYAKLLGIGLVVVVFGALLGAPMVAHAQSSFRSGNDVTVAKNEMVNSTLFTAGRSVDIDGSVDGDIFCAGQTVTISGQVHGDVICAAQTIVISGQIDGDVRLTGQTVTISGNISRNASVAAQSYTNTAEAVIGGDLSIAGENATLGGKVGRDLAFAGSELIINGEVGRKLTGNVEHLSVSNHGTIKEGGSYTSHNSAQVANGAVVGGELKQSIPQDESTSNGPNWAMRLYFFLAFLLGAFVLVLIKPKLFQQASQAAMDAPLKVMLVGFIASVAVPLVLVAVLFTVIGIPLGLLLLLAWGLVVTVSGVFAAYYLGRLLLARTHYTNALLYILLGGVILLLLSYIPIIGIITLLLALWFGLGIIVLHCHKHYSRPRYAMRETAKAEK